MKKYLLGLCLSFLCLGGVVAQTVYYDAVRQKYVRVDTMTVILTGVTVDSLSKLFVDSAYVRDQSFYLTDGTLEEERTILSGGNNLIYDGSGDIIFDDSGLLTAQRLSIDGTTCLEVSVDRIFHDTDCDGVMDVGENYIDELGGGGEDTSIYNIDGTLTGNRAVTLGSYDLNFDANTLVIDGSADKVGIGTASPATNMEISGTGGVTSRITSTNANVANLDLIRTGATSYRVKNNVGNFEISRSTDQFATTLSTPFHIGSNDRVGIGTTSPGEKFHVYDGIAEFQEDNRAINVNSINDANSEIFYQVQGVDKFRLGTVNAATNTGFRIRDEVAGTERIRIDTDGKVGIGTTSPAKPLHIESAVATMRFSDSDATSLQEVSGFFEWYQGNATDRAGWFGFGSGVNQHLDITNETTSGSIFLAPNNSRALTVEASGEVGIGTTSPDELLDIEDGSIRLTNTGGELDPSIRIQSEDGLGTSWVELVDKGITQARLDKVTSAGAPLLDLNPIAQDAVSTQNVRIFRASNAGGAAVMDLYSPGTSTIVHRLRTDGGGNSYLATDGTKVGIGTASPSNPLEIVSSGQSSLRLDNQSGSNYIIVESDDNAAGFELKAEADTDNHFWRMYSNTNGDLYFYDVSNTTTRMVIRDQDGNVGIGAASPDVKLHVNGGTNDINIRMESTDAGAYIDFEDSGFSTQRPTIGAVSERLVIRTGGAENFSVQNDGTIDFDDYGAGNNTGTATYLAAFDASGNVIEEEGRHDISIQVVNRTTEVATGESEAYFVVGREHDGLTCDYVSHKADSGTGSFTLQIREDDTVRETVTVNTATDDENPISPTFTLTKGDIIDANISAVATPGLDGLTITISCKL